VAASLAFRPSWPPEAVARLALVAGLAAVDVAGEQAALKWPNDLVVGDRKVGGLLAEAAGGVVVIGLGLNLYWPDPMVGAGALHAVDPGPEAAVSLAEAWSAALLGRAECDPEHWGRDEYAARCVTIGTEITWEPDGRGRAVGVSAEGGLEVDVGAGRVVLHGGEVRRVRTA
jgi:BirA family biotin operon repressor/biotin-[acetyl-CoA-carboxylase] ligase